MSGMRFPQRAGWAPLRPSHRTTRRPSARRSPCFLCQMMQKAPKMLAVMLNCPYLCSTHLQIEGVSGLDRLDAASSPAFFWLACRTPRVDTVECPPLFLTNVGASRRKLPLSSQNPPILSPPSAPCRQKGAKFCRFVSPAALAHGLQISGRTARRSSPPGRPPTAQGFRTRAPHGAPHNHTFIQQTTKK